MVHFPIMSGPERRGKCTRIEDFDSLEMNSRNRKRQSTAAKAKDYFVDF